MEILKSLFRKRSRTKDYNESTLVGIRKNLAEYSGKHISIIECVSRTGPLTTDWILTDSPEKKDVYDTILIMISNYYIMLHMDMYTGFYSVNRNHTSNLVAGLVEDVLKEASKKHHGLKSTDYNEAIQKSREFTVQMVEVYYRVGIEGCHKYLSSSIYSVLLSVNKNLSVKRDRIESLIRSIQADKYLSGNNLIEELSLEHTG